MAKLAVSVELLESLLFPNLSHIGCHIVGVEMHKDYSYIVILELEGTDVPKDTEWVRAEIFQQRTTVTLKPTESSFP